MKKLYELVKNNFSTRYIFWLALLCTVILWGGYAAFLVIKEGLKVTGMNNVNVWGLWVVNDYFFIAISGGAFSIAAMVYLFKVKRFKPLLRLAVFLGLIGYIVATLNIILDIGRPERFWHAFVWWNPLSFMWEVILCITVYFLILIMEFSPAVSESKVGEKLLPNILKKIIKVLHRLAPALAVFGLIFSLMHQASLGAVYSAVEWRPYWHRPNIPPAFVLSAIISGLSFLTLVVILNIKFFKRTYQQISNILFELSKVILVVFSIYALIRVWDIIDLFHVKIRPESLNLLQVSIMFWLVEVVVGLILPLVLLLIPKVRRSLVGLSIISILILIGTYASRWNVLIPEMSISLIYPYQDILRVSYSPTWVEWASASGTIAFGLLLFSLGIKFIPLLPGKIDQEEVSFVTL